MKKDDFLQAIEELKGALDGVDYEQINKIANVIIDALRKGSKLLICGNGGSAADAQHMAAEFVNRFLRERQPLAAIALSTDTSNITSIANDYSFDEIFSKQIRAIARKGDIVFGISTSGNSKNIIEAFRIAKQMNLITIGLLGKDGGKLKELSDFALTVKSWLTPRIQEVHIFIIHTICQMVEDAFTE